MFISFHLPKNVQKLIEFLMSTDQARLDRALQLHDLKTLYTVLKEEINSLKEQLQKERDDKEKLIEWIKVNLGPNLGQVKTLIHQVRIAKHCNFLKFTDDVRK